MRLLSPLWARLLGLGLLLLLLLLQSPPAQARLQTGQPIHSTSHNIAAQTLPAQPTLPVSVDIGATAATVPSGARQQQLQPAFGSALPTVAPLFPSGASQGMQQVQPQPLAGVQQVQQPQHPSAPRRKLIAEEIYRTSSPYANLGQRQQQVGTPLAGVQKGQQIESSATQQQKTIQQQQQPIATPAAPLGAVTEPTVPAAPVTPSEQQQQAIHPEHPVQSFLPAEQVTQPVEQQQIHPIEPEQPSLPVEQQKQIPPEEQIKTIAPGQQQQIQRKGETVIQQQEAQPILPQQSLQQQPQPFSVGVGAVPPSGASQQMQPQQQIQPLAGVQQPIIPPQPEKPIQQQQQAIPLAGVQQPIIPQQAEKSIQQQQQQQQPVVEHRAEPMAGVKPDPITQQQKQQPSPPLKLEHAQEKAAPATAPVAGVKPAESISQQQQQVEPLKLEHAQEKITPSAPLAGVKAAESITQQTHPLKLEHAQEKAAVETATKPSVEAATQPSVDIASKPSVPKEPARLKATEAAQIPSGPSIQTIPPAKITPVGKGVSAEQQMEQEMGIGKHKLAASFPSPSSASLLLRSSGLSSSVRSGRLSALRQSSERLSALTSNVQLSCPSPQSCGLSKEVLSGLSLEEAILSHPDTSLPALHLTLLPFLQPLREVMREAPCNITAVVPASSAIMQFFDWKENKYCSGPTARGKGSESCQWFSQLVALDRVMLSHSQQLAASGQAQLQRQHMQQLSEAFEQSVGAFIQGQSGLQQGDENFCDMLSAETLLLPEPEEVRRFLQQLQSGSQGNQWQQGQQQQQQQQPLSPFTPQVQQSALKGRMLRGSSISPSVSARHVQPILSGGSDSASLSPSSSSSRSSSLLDQQATRGPTLTPAQPQPQPPCPTDASGRAGVECPEFPAWVPQQPASDFPQQRLQPEQAREGRGQQPSAAPAVFRLRPFRISLYMQQSLLGALSAHLLPYKMTSTEAPIHIIGPTLLSDPAFVNKEQGAGKMEGQKQQTEAQKQQTKMQTEPQPEMEELHSRLRFRAAPQYERHLTPQLKQQLKLRQQISSPSSAAATTFGLPFTQLQTREATLPMHQQRLSGATADSSSSSLSSSDLAERERCSLRHPSMQLSKARLFHFGAVQSPLQQQQQGLEQQGQSSFEVNQARGRLRDRMAKQFESEDDFDDDGDEFDWEDWQEGEWQSARLKPVTERAGAGRQARGGRQQQRQQWQQQQPGSSQLGSYSSRSDLEIDLRIARAFAVTPAELSSSQQQLQQLQSGGPSSLFSPSRLRSSQSMHLEKQEDGWKMMAGTPFSYMPPQAKIISADITLKDAVLHLTDCMTPLPASTSTVLKWNGLNAFRALASAAGQQGKDALDHTPAVTIMVPEDSALSQIMAQLPEKHIDKLVRDVAKYKSKMAEMEQAAAKAVQGGNRQQQQQSQSQQLRRPAQMQPQMQSQPQPQPLLSQPGTISPVTASFPSLSQPVSSISQPSSPSSFQVNAASHHSGRLSASTIEPWQMQQQQPTIASQPWQMQQQPIIEPQQQQQQPGSAWRLGLGSSAAAGQQQWQSAGEEDEDELNPQARAEKQQLRQALTQMKGQPSDFFLRWCRDVGVPLPRVPLQPEAVRRGGRGGAQQPQQRLMTPQDMLELLSAHIFPGLVHSPDFSEQKEMVALNGARFAFNCAGGSWALGDANILLADLPSKNAVIHIIDKVLGSSAWEGQQQQQQQPMEMQTAAGAGVGVSSQQIPPVQQLQHSGRQQRLRGLTPIISWSLAVPELAVGSAGVTSSSISQQQQLSSSPLRSTARSRLSSRLSTSARLSEQGDTGSSFGSNDLCLSPSAQKCQLVDSLSTNPSWLSLKSSPQNLFSASNVPESWQCSADAQPKSYSLSAFSSPTWQKCYDPSVWKCSRGMLLLKASAGDWEGQPQQSESADLPSSRADIASSWQINQPNQKKQTWRMMSLLNF